MVIPPPPPFSFADEVEWYLKLARPGFKSFEEGGDKMNNVTNVISGRTLARLG